MPSCSNSKGEIICCLYLEMAILFSQLKGLTKQVQEAEENAKSLLEAWNQHRRKMKLLTRCAESRAGLKESELERT